MASCDHSVQFHGLCALCGSIVDVGSSEQQEYIQISHDNKLKVKHEEAARIQTEALSNLKESSRLILIIDLDQTLVHATVDPCVHGWLQMYPGHPVISDIHSFHLPDSPNFTYFIKLRPNTRAFLDNLAKYFELHIYTMGSRNYADAVAKVLDPDRSLFQDRILSRDESGSFSTKNIARLFPQDQSMVVVLDDRADVWQYSPNLIRIRPYSYFAGTGDINQPLGADGNPLPAQTSSSHEAEPASKEPYFLSDSDSQLDILLPTLIDIHTAYYASTECDVRSIIPKMKSQVLEGVTICFSSVFPLHTAPESHDIWNMARSFGAECTVELNSSVTHVVAVKKGTKKCLAARKMKGVRVVSPMWLLDSVFDWDRKDEQNYLLYQIREESPDEEDSLGDEPLLPSVKSAPVLLRVGEDEWDEINKELEELSGEDDEEEDGEEDKEEEDDRDESEKSIGGYDDGPSPGQNDEEDWSFLERELEQELLEENPSKRMRLLDDEEDAE